eukprot:4005828-Alexandrium_andersonii.AAC.1
MARPTDAYFLAHQGDLVRRSLQATGAYFMTYQGDPFSRGLGEPRTPTHAGRAGGRPAGGRREAGGNQARAATARRGSGP